ncbi:XcyI family restriction endonuclease [Lyngbya aestuarii]|uniref:XcyI family restriction endonuclease n=1 Tax=Lyngbya aestuarii TaxID=118322 RepID=UPI00403DC8A8
MTPNEKKALKAHYTLRSSTFFRKLNELSFFEFGKRIKALAELDEAFSWDNRSEWGIAECAWDIIRESEISPLFLFLHPRILQEQPALLAYYRSVALLSQKGLKQILSIAVEGIEQSAKVPSREKVQKICLLINEFMSILIESVDGISLEQISGMMFASAGTQIQGSWNNAIGLEGELLVRKLIIREFLNKNIIKGYTLNNGETFPELEKPLESAINIKVILLTTQGSIVFGSEPDISIYDKNGVVRGDIEIKAGIDPGGALERLGAAMKSFEKTRLNNPLCECLYLCSCVTEEVAKRVAESRNFGTMYTLNEIIYESNKKDEFLNRILSLAS